MTSCAWWSTKWKTTRISRGKHLRTDQVAATWMMLSLTWCWTWWLQKWCAWAWSLLKKTQKSSVNKWEEPLQLQHSISHPDSSKSSRLTPHRQGRSLQQLVTSPLTWKRCWITQWWRKWWITQKPSKWRWTWCKVKTDQRLKARKQCKMRWKTHPLLAYWTTLRWSRHVWICSKQTQQCLTCFKSRCQELTSRLSSKAWAGYQLSPGTMQQLGGSLPTKSCS